MCLAGWNAQGTAVFGQWWRTDWAGGSSGAQKLGIVFANTSTSEASSRYEFTGDKVPLGSDWRLVSIEEVYRRRGWFLDKSRNQYDVPDLKPQLEACQKEKRELEKNRDRTREELLKAKNLLDEVYVSLGISVGDSNALLAALDSISDN